MDWMQLAVQLTREAMKSGERESAQAPPPPTDLGLALKQQFDVVDQSLDAFARAMNAQNKKLEDTIRRQRIWNVVLAVGLLIALIIALVR